jgi:hypothetical protein
LSKKIVAPLAPKTTATRSRVVPKNACKPRTGKELSSKRDHNGSGVRDEESANTISVGTTLA